MVPLRPREAICHRERRPMLPALRRRAQIGGIRNNAISPPHINISESKNGGITGVLKGVGMKKTAAVSRKPV
jgi:hypothetical protein